MQVTRAKVGGLQRQMEVPACLHGSSIQEKVTVLRLGKDLIYEIIGVLEEENQYRKLKKF